MPEYTLEQLRRLHAHLDRRLARFELKLAKEAYAKGLYGYMLLEDGTIERYDTYKLFKKIYKRYVKRSLLEDVFYKEKV